MKITKVTPLVLGTVWRDLAYFKVETDEGLVGYGDARAMNKTQALIGYMQEAVPYYILGHDPFNIELLVQRMMREDYARAGEIAMTGIAVIEMACWDIIGKALNQPVYKLLGGAVRDKIKVYANGWYRTERTPDAFHAAAKKVVEKGYRALKFDPFGASFYDFERKDMIETVSLVEAVRDAVGDDVDILIEMHGRFTPSGAVTIANELAQFRPSWYEEPVPPENLKALKKVMDAVAPLGIPIATGERIHVLHEYRELFELQAADVIQPDITHFGGLLSMKKLAGWADAYYIRLAPHNVAGPVATAAAFHFAACTTNVMIQENFNDFDAPYVNESAPGLPAVVDGFVPLPDKPGLGITINEDVVEAHPSQAVRFNLFQDNWHHRDMTRTS